MVFVTDPMDEHGANYVKQTWGQSTLARLLEDIQQTGERRIFTSVMHQEIAESELPLEEMRKVISEGSPPEGCSAWMFGVGGGHYALFGLPEWTPESK